mgnify:CR=1 FL=1
MLTVAGVPHLNGCKRAVHAVTIVRTVRHAARYSAVDFVHLTPPYAGSIGIFFRNYSKRVDKADVSGYNINRTRRQI